MENDRFRSKLSAYKDGELDGNLSAEVSLHLLNCAACMQELAEFEQIDSLVKEMPQVEPGESFSLQIIAGIPTNKRDRFDSASLFKRVHAKFLSLADSIFELVSGREHDGDTLDEFGDFPPLSISHAYFQVLGEQR